MVVRIRRSALSPEPTDVITAPFTESESELSVGAGKRKRKRRRSPGGLGRGLARILTDSQTERDAVASPDSGLLQLVGAQSNAKATKVRSFVVDTALSTLADAFGLDGVVLATRSPVVGELDREHQTPTFLAAILPPSWSSDSQLLFEIYGNLWRVLRQRDESATENRNGGRHQSGTADAEDDQPLDEWQTTIGRHSVWMARMDDGPQPVAAVAIRDRGFEPPESDALAQLLGSVVAACSETPEGSIARHTIGRDTAVTLKTEGADVLAEVTASWPQAEDSDPVNAVARAAAKACRPRCELTFAGASELDDAQVSIVMIRDANQSLRLGYAVRQKGDHSGAAEAVFTAAGANPAI